MSILSYFLAGVGRGFAFGAGVLFFYFQLSKNKMEAAFQKRLSESEMSTREKLAGAEQRAAAAETRYRAAKENQNELIEQLRKQFEDEKATLLKQFQEARGAMERQWQEKTEAQRLEFENLSNQQIEIQKTKIESVNKASVEELLKPLREKIKDFSEAFEKNNSKQTELRTAVETSIKNLMLQTQQIGANAEKLTQALKADPKKQGNWGETVLQNILDASGMTPGRDYYAQAAECDESGKRLIPDIKVRIPNPDGEGEEGFILIDSKVSITHYLNFMQTDDEKQKELHLKKHIQSVQKHVQELSEKNYAQKIKNSFGYVMMFIPNEGGYLLAVENAPQLVMEAYRRNIVILNPTNLMLALNLIRQLWQSRKQAENVQAIIDTANKIYKKFAGVTDDLEELGQHLNQSVRSFNSALSRFTVGRGNLVKSFENWKELGISANSRIAPRLLELSALSVDDKSV